MLELKFADVGEGINEGTVLKLNFKVGDHVTEGDVLAIVETDKVNAELPAPSTGIIIKLGVKEGEQINVGDIIAIIGDEKDLQNNQNNTSQTISADSLKKNDNQSVVGNLKNSSDVIFSPKEDILKTDIPINSHRILASPLVRSMAKKMGIDLMTVKGTGINGKILKIDLENIQNNQHHSPSLFQDHSTESSYVEMSSNVSVNSSNVEVIKISRLRKAISQQMVISKNNIADVTLVDEVDVSNLVLLRKQVKQQTDSKGIKLTYMAFIMKSVILALKDFPIFNAVFNDDKDEVIIKKYINLGIAVDTKDGLIVPNIKNAQELSIFGLAEELQKTAAETVERKVTIDKLKDGTFTITNFGAVDISYGTPIINFPELAILGVGKISKKPIVEQNQVIIADMLPLSLTIDHRIIDGANGGRFLKRIKEILKNPSLFLLF